VHRNAISASEELNKEDNMDMTRQAILAQQALSEIEQLLNNYDLGGQIEAALPLLLRQRRTLTTLRNALQTAPRTTSPRADERWVDDLVAVYGELGGQAFDSVVYRRMKQLRQKDGRSWPPSAHSAIRQTRQAHNAESRQYRDAADLFRMVRPGLWRLKEYGTH
jgi:hypothetical protein